MFSFLGLFMTFLLLGVPISLALGVGGMLYLAFTDNWSLVGALPQRMLAGVDQFVLLTIPLFLLAGNLMNLGGLSDRMIKFANALVGHMKGGLSLVTVLASIMFAGISGSAIAQSSAIGSLMIPAMARQGIPAAYGAALVAMSAVIDPLIPPSITMIIYGVLSGASIGQMFIAGIIPGLLLGLSLLGYAYWKAWKYNFPSMPRADWGERGRSLVAAIPALMLPVIIVGGVKSGIFTMTESAAVAVGYAFIVGALHRELTMKRLWEALCTTAITTSGLLFILAMASIVAFALTVEEVPTRFAESLLSISDNKLVVLLMLNIMLLLLGKFLEPISVMIVTMPILMKVCTMIGMDPVQFGVMVTLNVVIGMVTPPVGVCLFVVCAIAGKSVIEVSREVLPMFFICLVLLAVVATIPAVTLALPHLMLGAR
ncbi:TRAP transporter large permease [Phreatobacter stygius]|uniref:TRAP transporter large permease protein n=1 Tax=Phreatobacter stygius TaxID=1940610 RepID=A0A4D7B8T2_9HYPH|nr:TRAP transporter large permease [Phreatobacter stygius]QCI67253.1 TRAP transporter large permease [Phreatobacter stygius]